MAAKPVLRTVGWMLFCRAANGLNEPSGALKELPGGGEMISSVCFNSHVHMRKGAKREKRRRDPVSRHLTDLSPTDLASKLGTLTLEDVRRVEIGVET